MRTDVVRLAAETGGVRLELELAVDPITVRAEDLGILPEELEPYGRHAGKIDLAAIERLRGEPDGRLVCVTAITPTKAGEGKTTTATRSPTVLLAILISASSSATSEMMPGADTRATRKTPCANLRG